MIVLAALVILVAPIASFLIRVLSVAKAEPAAIVLAIVVVAVILALFTTRGNVVIAAAATLLVARVVPRLEWYIPSCC